MARTKLYRRRRAAARVSLYSSFILVGAIGAALYPLLRKPLDIGERVDWYYTDYEALREVQLLQQLVQIDTTAETGNEIEAAEFLARQLEEAGIPAHVARVGERQANLWAILEGEDPNALVLHNHLDVDPIKRPEKWRHPPLSGSIEPPWIYGRGTFDMKSVTIAQLLAVLGLKERQIPLRRSVIFLATSSEEKGSDLGTRWILRQHPELVSRFWAVLTEGGVLEATGRDEIKYWGTEFAQKRFVSVIACSHSRERLEDLARDILERGQPLTALTVPRDVEAFLAVYTESRTSPDLRRLLRGRGTLPRRLLDFLALPDYLKAMFRNEVHPFPIEEDPEGGYRMRISLHLVPEADTEAVLSELLPAWMTHGVGLSVDDRAASREGSPLDHLVFRTIHATLEERFPGISLGPYFLPFAATDARFFRAAAIPSYGFTPFLVLTSDAMSIGGIDERIALPAYLDGVELYTALVQRLVGAEPTDTRGR